MSRAQIRRWLLLVLLIAGSGALVAIGSVSNRWQPTCELPQSWLVLRPPDEV